MENPSSLSLLPLKALRINVLMYLINLTSSQPSNALHLLFNGITTETEKTSRTQQLEDDTHVVNPPSLLPPASEAENRT